MSEVRERYWWKNTESQQILNRGYLLQGESVEGAIDRVCSAAAKNLFRPELKEAFKEMVERGWMSLSSPIWANMGTERGLPISCFNVHVPDRIEDITHKLGEVIMQTKIGGGTSGYFGSLRERGSAVKDNGKSSGAVSFMKLFDTTMDTISQGGVRRGAFAAYLDIDHPDIEEFLAIKSIGSPIQNLFYAVCVPDYWLNEMIEGDMEKRKTWAKVLENRQQKGLPYIFFTDNINRNKPQVYKDKGMMINASNLCSEIVLPSSKDESFICCLSSLNLEMYDEWKDTTLVKDLIHFLDNVLQFFIDHAPDVLHKAKYSATREGSLGLGAMGYHSYLQKNNIPFEKSDDINEEIFDFIKHEAVEESKRLAKEKGEAPDMKGTGMRNAHLLAIAPNANSSMIVATSPSIEPNKANAYTHRTRAGSHLIKNKYLVSLLDKYDMNKTEVWTSIITNGGSVQHLTFLSNEEKEVFKTAVEIDQIKLVGLAGQRQKHLCQGQSLNVFFPAGASKKYLQKVHFKAWENECKGLYYLRTETTSKAEKVSDKVALDKLRDYSELKQEEEECIACQG